MHPADPRTTWWFWRHVQDRLTTFTLALVSPLRGKRYRVRLAQEGTGYHDPVNRVIHANPGLFPDEPPAVQFRATQGLLAHEVGHALFTASWPDAQENLLCQMTNILEDQRIEAALAGFYPGIAPALTLLGDLCWARLAGSHADPRWQAVVCCLGWRWAHTRSDEAGLLAQLKVNATGAELWRRIRPAVEAAWAMPDTDGVIAAARQILDALSLPYSSAPLASLGGLVSLRGVPARRPDAPLEPGAPAPALQPGLGGGDEDAAGPALPADDFLQPEPYTALEDSARPLARQLAEALRVPEPETHPEPHAWRGRYAFRQEARTPETPCLHAQGSERRPRSIALAVLVDRSGSMEELEPHVQLALMTLYLAATDLEIPISLTAFGANHDRDPKTFTFPIAAPFSGPLSARAAESSKALIAGYRGTTNNEFLDWGLRLAERELMARPERLKAVVVIHDGQPVYSGRLGSDWTLALQRLRQMEAAGLTPIGIYLGGQREDEARLRQLFRWLVVCAGEELPEKLGDLLRSLA